jgi:hypothetical protein
MRLNKTMNLKKVKGKKGLSARISIDSARIVAFCQKWKIIELSLFGSVLRNDFGPNSDVDVLISFALGVEWSLLNHVQMEEELCGILGRKVDLITRRAVERSENWIRRRAILSSTESLYVEG